MVFLQEVVPHNLEVLESLLGEYLIIPADGNGYFTAMLLKMATVKYEEHSIQAFYASKMGRNLMVTQVKVLLLLSLLYLLLLLLFSLSSLLLILLLSLSLLLLLVIIIIIIIIIVFIVIIIIIININ